MTLPVLYLLPTYEKMRPEIVRKASCRQAQCGRAKIQ
jgi:hypothetical protein